MSTPIRTLVPGTRFAQAWNAERTGTLVRIGDSGALVRYGRPRHVELPNGRAFDAQPETVTISLETDVVAL